MLRLWFGLMLSFGVTILVFLIVRKKTVLGALPQFIGNFDRLSSTDGCNTSALSEATARRPMCNASTSVPSVATVQMMYDKFVVKDAAYLARWENMSPETGLQIYVNSDKGGDKVRWDFKWKDYPRIPCVHELKVWVDKHNLHPKHMVTTNLYDPEMSVIPYDNVLDWAYDTAPSRDRDLHHLRLPPSKLPSGKYDFFLVSQTFEHILDPVQAANNIYDSLEDGGYLFASVPSQSVPHSVPIYYQQFTPIGFLMLWYRTCFEIIEFGLWGNTDYQTFLIKNLDWPDIHSMSKPIKNDPKRSSYVWVLARKTNHTARQ